MNWQEHYYKLEKMYQSAPINAFYEPEITVGEATSEISMKIKEQFHHAAHAMHGSVYFKMLDDAAFFAVNSIVSDVFVLTTSFHLHFLRPASEGVITAKGKVVYKSKGLFVAEAQLFDEKERKIGMGSGNFVKSKIELTGELGYE